MKYFRGASAIIVVLAVLVRIPGLGDAFYGDEAFSVLRDSARLITTSEDRFRPVFFSLLYLWRELGFHGEVGLRSLPFLFGVAQVPLAIAVGRRLGSERLALAWGTLVALSPMLVEFSQELRMYSFVAFLALAQAWATLRVEARASLGRWAAFVAIGLIGVYTHLHYWIFLAGTASLFLWNRRIVRLRQTALAFAALVVGYLPNVPNLLAFNEARGGKYVVAIGSAIPKLVAALMVGFDYFRVGEQSEGRALGGRDFAMNAPLIVLAAVPILIVAGALVRAHMRRGSDALVVGHTLCTVPVLLASALTLVTHQYWLHPKYVIFGAPFFLLILAQGFILLERQSFRWAAALSSFVVFGIALSRFWRPTDYGRREDWRGAAQTLARDTEDGGTALVVLPQPYGLLQYYWPDAARHWTLVEPPPVEKPANDLETLASQLKRAASGKTRIVYLRWDTVQNERDPNDLIPKAMATLGTPEPIVQLNPRLVIEAWRLSP